MVFTTTAGAAVEKRSIAHPELQGITFGGVTTGITIRCEATARGGKSATYDTSPGIIRPKVADSNSDEYTIGLLKPLFNGNEANTLTAAADMRLRSQYYPPAGYDGGFLTWDYTNWNGPWFPCKTGYTGDVPTGQLTAVMRISLDIKGFQAGTAYNGFISFEPLRDGTDSGDRLPNFQSTSKSVNELIPFSGTLPSITAYNASQSDIGYVDIDLVAAMQAAGNSGSGNSNPLTAGRGGTWGTNDDSIESSAFKISLQFQIADKKGKTKPLIMSNLVAHPNPSSISAGFDSDTLAGNSTVGPMVAAIKVGSMGLTRVTGSPVEVPFIGGMDTTTAMAFSQTSWDNTVNGGAGTSTGDNKPYVINNVEGGAFEGSPTIARFDCVMDGLEWPIQAKFRGQGDGSFTAGALTIWLQRTGGANQNPYTWWGPTFEQVGTFFTDMTDVPVSVNFGSGWVGNPLTLPTSINWSTYQPHGGAVLSTLLPCFVAGGPSENETPVDAVPSAFDPPLDNLKLGITNQDATGLVENWRDQYQNPNWFYLNESNISGGLPAHEFLGAAVQDP